jgi:hypothetical protein
MAQTAPSLGDIEALAARVVAALPFSINIAVLAKSRDLSIRP